MRTCKKCHLELDESKFNKDPNRKDGLHPYCTPCKTKPYKVDPEIIAAKALALRTRTEKYCAQCQSIKPLTEFFNRKASVDGKWWTCKPCATARRKRDYDKAKLSGQHTQYYYDNKERILFESRQKRRALKTQLVEIKGGSCVDCNRRAEDEWPVECFDFHHVNGKTFTISTKMKVSHLPKLLVELEKCVLLCSNCHRRRHASATIQT